MTKKLVLECPRCKETKFTFDKDRDIVECMNEECWYRAYRQTLIEQQNPMYGMPSIMRMTTNSFGNDEHIKEI